MSDKYAPRCAQMGTIVLPLDPKESYNFSTLIPKIYINPHIKDLKYVTEVINHDNYISNNK
jgi:hypothetical protein